MIHHRTKKQSRSSYVLLATISMCMLIQFLSSPTPPTSSLQSDDLKCDNDNHYRDKLLETKDKSSLIDSQEGNPEPSYLSRLKLYITKTRNHLLCKITSPFIISADAVTISDSHSHQEAGIITLNSENFIDELVQYNQKLPHMKLVEYYLPINRFCYEFGPTYKNLAKEIFTWRNVIRLAALDVSKEDSIAHAWAIEEVPTLRIHPPSSPQESKILHDAYEAKKTEDKSNNELILYMRNKFSETNITTIPLSAAKYVDKLNLFKREVLQAIDDYARFNKGHLPSTWPNLHPVKETSLKELLNSHPRQELFLIIDAQSRPNQRNDGGYSSYSVDNDIEADNIGLNILMELSSSSAWRSVRYVRADENRPLIDDILNQLNKTSKIDAKLDDKSSESSTGETTLNLPVDDVVLIRVNDAHPSIKTGNSEISSVFSSPITKLVAKDLELMQIHTNPETDINGSRLVRRARQSNVDMSIQHKIDLIVRYIKQVYVKTNDDRAFVKSLDIMDRKLSSSPDHWEKEDSAIITTSTTTLPFNITEEKSHENMLGKLKNAIVNGSIQNNIFKTKFNTGSCSYIWEEKDYGDEIKAIQHIFETEIIQFDKFNRSLGLEEHIRRVDILKNLISVLKAYFPLPDVSSTQYLEGIDNYLTNERDRMLSIVNTTSTDNVQNGFDVMAFKQEIDFIKMEKRLPEVKSWSVCKDSGYPCALWRLFHTLTVFEYQKRIQIRPTNISDNSEPSVTMSSEPLLIEMSNNMKINDNKPSQAIEMAETKEVSAKIGGVEHFYSPPSAKTPLSLVISTNTSNEPSVKSVSGGGNRIDQINEVDLPKPVLLVMQSYITVFFNCLKCAKNFDREFGDVTVQTIQEHPEYSIIKLWQVHNYINRIISVDDTHSKDKRKVWYPSFEECNQCYLKKPSYLSGGITSDSVDSETMFKEPIEWDEKAVLAFLIKEYTKDLYYSGRRTMFDLYQYKFIMVCFFVSVMIMVYIFIHNGRSNRHKASIATNGNSVPYSTVLQSL